MAKLVTDTLLKKSVEDVLTELVNSTFDWQEYTDEEVGQLVELDPTQVAELSAVINDSVAATNKVYSSQHTKELIQENLIEANKYADDLVANLSNIKLDIVDSLPDSSTVNKSTIYILKDSSGGTNNTLNVWSDTTSAFVEVGKLSVNMDNYYTKREVDAELTKKANADEVLKPDAIVADLTTTSGSTTLSTAGLQIELDKKANDDEVLKTTDISTTIDGTSTNDTVPTNKSVYDSLLNKVNNPIVITTADEVNSFDRAYQSFIIEPSVAEAVGLPKAPDSTWFCINLSHFKGFKYPSQIAFEYAGIERIMYRTAHNGVWHNWRKLCTTSVPDTPTVIKSISSDEVVSGTLQYTVINGICHLCLLNLTFASTGIVLKMLPDDTVPRCAINECWSPITDTNGGTFNALIRVSMQGALGHYKLSDTSKAYSGYFSYPVAE